MSDDIDEYLQSLSNATAELQPVLDVAELARTVTELKKLRAKHNDRFEADVRQLIGWCNVRMRELKEKSRDALNAGDREMARIFLDGVDAIDRGPKTLALETLLEIEMRRPGPALRRRGRARRRQPARRVARAQRRAGLMTTLGTSRRFAFPACSQRRLSTRAKGGTRTPTVLPTGT